MNVFRPPRRKAQVKPTRDALPLPPDPAQRQPDVSFDAPVREPPRRSMPKLTVSQRRKQRRTQKMASTTDLPAAVPRDVPRTLPISWRLFSGAICIVLFGVLYFFLSNDAFRIHAIYVGYAGPTHYVDKSEIFGVSGTFNQQIFWADATDIEKQLEGFTQIASANVSIGWPNLVQITVTERQPALVWEQSGQRVWVDVRGRVMKLRQDLPELVRVVVEKPSKDVHLSKCERQGMDTALGTESCIDQDTVNGVLQFKALYPNVTEVVYDPIKGLGYHEGSGYTLWFGNGVDIPTKMAVFSALSANLQARGIQPVEINVANPDAPYYNVK